MMLQHQCITDSLLHDMLDVTDLEDILEDSKLKEKAVA